jgi:hypothetical protein
MLQIRKRGPGSSFPQVLFAGAWKSGAFVIEIVNLPAIKQVSSYLRNVAHRHKFIDNWIQP